MKFSLVVSRKALAQMEKARDWFNEQQPGLGTLFLSEMDKEIQYVQKNPLKSQIRYKSVRIRFLKKFTFGIHYLIEERTIFVLAIFHTSQSDKKWRRRT